MSKEILPGKPKNEEKDDRPKPVRREGLRQERLRNQAPPPPLIIQEKKRLRKLRDPAEKPEHWTAIAKRRRERLYGKDPTPPATPPE